MATRLYLLLAGMVKAFLAMRVGASWFTASMAPATISAR